MLRQDDAPANSVLSVFFAKHTVTVLEHPPFSPDVTLHDFFLFPKIKSELKGTRFESMETLKIKATEILNKLMIKELYKMEDLNGAV